MFIPVQAQNKKELNDDILKLKSDSVEMSKTISENNSSISQKIIETEKLNLIIKSYHSEIDRLNKIVAEKDLFIENYQKSLSKNNNRIDSLEIALANTTDSLNRLIKVNSIDSESNWIGITLMENLLGTWLDDCNDFNLESCRIGIEKTSICVGGECEIGGTILQIDYNLNYKQYRIKYINDNEMDGDGLPGELIFTISDNKLSFYDRYNKLRTVNKCNF
jgi:predicted HTH domain antitoxin